MKIQKKLLINRVLACGILAIWVLVGAFFAMPSITSYALEDSIGGSANSGSDSGSISNDDIAVGNYIKGQKGVTSDQLQASTTKVQPIVNIAGSIVGVGIAILFSWVFVVTILDLLVLGIPPLRKVFVKQLAQGAAGGGMTTGGMGMGRMGMMGNVGGGGGSGVVGAMTQWISDECLGILQTMSGGAGGGAAGGMAVGMGMGATNQQATPQQEGGKSLIFTYLKKRIFFMILLAISAIVLTSSVLLGTGINLGQWFIRMMDSLNNSIPH